MRTTKRAWLWTHAVRGARPRQDAATHPQVRSTPSATGSPAASATVACTGKDGILANYGATAGVPVCWRGLESALEGERSPRVGTQDWMEKLTPKSWTPLRCAKLPRHPSQNPICFQLLCQKRARISLGPRASDQERNKSLCDATEVRARGACNKSVTEQVSSSRYRFANMQASEGDRAPERATTEENHELVSMMCCQGRRSSYIRRHTKTKNISPASPGGLMLAAHAPIRAPRPAVTSESDRDFLRGALSSAMRTRMIPRHRGRDERERAHGYTSAAQGPLASMPLMCHPRAHVRDSPTSERLGRGP